MYTVCDDKLQTLTEWSYLAVAKRSAVQRSEEHPSQIFFVCDPSGMVVAGYGPLNLKTY